MSLLSEEMKTCLIEVDKANPDMSFEDTVLEAVWLHDVRNGTPVSFETEEEGKAFYREALAFVLDCTLLSLVAKGAVEVEGMEDGEFVYKVTVEF